MADTEQTNDAVPLNLKRWWAKEDLEDLETHAVRAVKASEAAVYDAAEQGDRGGMLEAVRALNESVKQYRALLRDQRHAEIVRALIDCPGDAAAR